MNNIKYIILGLGMALVVFVVALAPVRGLQGAYVTWVNSNNYINATTAGSWNVEGGNITGLTLVTNTSTDKWGGYFGNITGSILLADTDSRVFYYWAYNATNDSGEVCASQSSAAASPLVATTAAAIDADWHFADSASDNAVRTFLGSGCKNLTNIASSDLSASINATHKSTWYTCAANNTAGSGEAAYWFCTSIRFKNTCWDGSDCDFEIMVPTTSAAGASGRETYYFYAELGS